MKNWNEQVIGERMRQNQIVGYRVVIEKAKNNYSAYSPDVPGCIATGKTRQETEKRMREAIQFHIEGLLKDGLPIPLRCIKRATSNEGG